MTSDERDELATLQRVNGPSYRAYLLKESLLAVLDGLQINAAMKKLDDWIGWARRSRLPAFVKLSRAIANHIEGILSFVQTRASNGRVEGLNGKARTIKRGSYGFRVDARLHRHALLIGASGFRVGRCAWAA